MGDNNKDINPLDEDDIIDHALMFEKELKDHPYGELLMEIYKGNESQFAYCNLLIAKGLMKNTSI